MGVLVREAVASKRQRYLQLVKVGFPSVRLCALCVSVVVQARISHQLSAAASDAPHPAVFSRLGVLDVPQVRAPRPSGRKPHWARHLAALATKPGEIRGLAPT